MPNVRCNEPNKSKEPLQVLPGPGLKPNKGKAPIQGSPQKMHEGASSGQEPRKATSLQNMYPTIVTYSSGYMAITLQEVKNKAL